MNFSLNQTYSFSTLAPSVLGANFNHVTVDGIINYTEACKFINVDAMHANIFPLLPVGTPSNYKNYIYIVIRSAANIKTVLAVPWIDASTIKVISQSSVQITIANATEVDRIKIEKFLVSLGYSSITSSVV